MRISFKNQREDKLILGEHNVREFTEQTCTIKKKMLKEVLEAEEK